AISRCLDLIAQVDKVGKSRHQELDDRVALIDHKLGQLYKAKSMAHRSKGTTNLATSLCVMKAAIGMSQSVLPKDDKFKPLGTREQEPLLKFSFSDSVIDHIASLGKVIITNFIDKQGRTLQVETHPTPLIPPRNSTMNRYVMHQFYRYHQALLSRCNKSAMNSKDLSSIGAVSAPLVIMPPSLDHIHMVEVVSSDTADPAPRYKLICLLKGPDRAASEAAATTAVLEPGAESSTAHSKKTPSILIKKRVVVHPATSSSRVLDHCHDNPSTNQPGPSSPKRIKVEEEEEEMDGTNHMENLMSFAEDCEKAVKYEDELAFMDDEVKIEVDEGG
ncbi:hypothetical protein PFISCL1PPCAC_21547, partial [Pristionchus fissidentatus]